MADATSTSSPTPPLLAPSPVPASSNTYPEDVVSILDPITGEETHAVVIRCWADEPPEAAAEAARLNIPFVPLKAGELEVLQPNGHRVLVQESATSLVDRGFMMGDVVRPVVPSSGQPKSRKRKPQAGIITSLSTSVSLERALTGEKIDGVWDAKDLVGASRINRGDHVVHGVWVGLVEEVFEVAMVETSSGSLRRVCDTGGGLTVGSTAETLMLDRTFFPPATDLRRVIDVRQLVVAVNWLCVSQSPLPETAPPPISGSVDERPKRFWTDLQHLALVRAAADHLHSIGDRVIFRSPPSPLPSSTALERGHQVLIITRTSSLATVLFQDGTTATGPTTTFTHCLDLDEDLDVFPGDVGVFSPQTEKKIAVVQSMDARARTLSLRYLSSSGVNEGGEETETVSGLEFDPHGPPPEVYGVRRQDWVLVCEEGKGGNGAEVPTVPRLGENEALVGAFPSAEALRVELSAIGLARVATLGDAAPPVPLTTPSELAHITFYGSVSSLLLSGLVLVRLPSGVEEPFPLSKLYHLDDGMEFGPGGPPGSQDGDEGSEMDDMDEEGDREWETDEEGEVLMPGDEEDGEGWADEVSRDEEEEGVPVVEIELDPVEMPVERKEEKGKEVLAMPMEVEEDERWQRFLILEEVPEDHYYAKETIQVPSRAFMTRVKKEYGVLSSSLPPNILVRAYESRADLLRCLIIGPLATPFANAPFLFDIFLPPAAFPQEPPRVHFHSWAGGTRVSPNLYAEGKVCLSLLGTWSGEKSEGWSAAKSSLLQVFISIQSLVMVTKPYFTEPGFEKHEGTPDAEVASDLYNERTFVLTRQFIKRGVEFPPPNFVEEIKAYYLSGLPTTGPGALKGVVEQSRALLKESHEYHLKERERVEAEGEEAEEKGREGSEVLREMRVLTEGAGLSLKRTLEGLETLLSRNS